MKLTANPALGFFHVWVGSSGAKLVRIMRLTTIIILAACLQSSANGLAQNTVTFSGKDVNLESVFTAIKKQTNYRFFFNTSIIQNASKITIEVKNAPIEQVMNLALKDQSLTFAIKGRTIFVMKKAEEERKTSFNQLPLNPIDVKGKVVNENGEPIQASITIKGSTRGTTTNQNGEFQLFNVEEHAILLVSGIGIENKEINVSGLSQIMITVKIAIRPLDEVQTIAYGTTTQRFSTGNVSQIKSNEIQLQPINNPLLALEGRVAGLFITQNTGVAGGGINISIRGKNSISGLVDPLYIIDGVPYSSQLLPNSGNNILRNANGNFSYGAGNPLSYIDPASIESISILKDADATAIYGSRGANGVVLITTKKGRIGKAEVNLDVSTGIGKVSKKMDFLDTQQYLQMRREAFKNDNVTPTVSNAPDILVWDTTRYTDWQKELIGGTARYSNFHASLSGGNANNQYLISAGYSKQTNVFPGDFADQNASVHFNLGSTSSNQKFRSVFSGSYLTDKNILPTADFNTYLNTPPDAPEIYNSDGSLNWANSTWPSNNPLYLTKTLYKVRTNNLLSNLNLSYHLLPGLEVTTNLGYTNMQVNEISTSPIASFDPAYSNTTGSTSFTNNSRHTWIVEPQLTYQGNIGKGKLDVLIGSTFQETYSEGSIIRATGYTNDALLQNIQASANRSVTSVTDILYRYDALFGRIKYNLLNKYILDLNTRRDGSSRFGDHNKFQNFGSVGAAWIFSKEKYFESALSFLSFGKLRGSIGTTGSDQIGDYSYYDLFNAAQYTYQGVVGLTPGSLYNPYLQWEKTKKAEISTELGFIKDRILINASFYFNKSSNQLAAYSLPATTGFSSITSNFPATVENKGWEFAITSQNIRNKKISWTSTFNLTIPKNKLTAFPNLSNSAYRNLYIIGEPLTIKRVYRGGGINDTTGVYQFIDSKGSLTYNPALGTDNIGVVNTAPQFYGGIANSISIRGLQIDFAFQFVKQNGLNYLFQGFNPLGRFGVNTIEPALNRWQKSGDRADYQKFTQSNTSLVGTVYQNAAVQSNYAYVDASYIRLKNCAISYTLPNSIVQKMHISNCKFYMLAQNLLTITKYKGSDPETQGINVLPPLRIITWGLNIML